VLLHRILYCLLFQCLLCPYSIAQSYLSYQEYKFITLNANQKLSNPKVIDLFQDRYGFVWVGTGNNLYRYDGNEFIPFRNIPEDSESLSSNNISQEAFQEDKEGNLWVATFDGGLNKFNRKTEKFQRFQSNTQNKNSLSSNSLNAIISDGKNGLWIATVGKGLNHLQFGDSTLCTIYHSKTNSPDTLAGSNTIVSLLKDKQNNLWIGTNNGVSRLDVNNQSFERHQPNMLNKGSLSGAFVTGILEDKQGDIWIATNNGLNLWNAKEKAFTKISPKEHLPALSGNYDYILEIIQDKQGTIWLGTLAGLVSYDAITKVFRAYLNNPNDPFSIVKGSVYALMEDSAGNVWIGADKGISILNRTSALLNGVDFLPLQRVFKQIVGDNGIRSVLQTSHLFWIATQKGLFKYTYPAPPELFMEGDFTTLFQDSKGIIYAGTINQGFYTIHPDGKQYQYQREIKLPYSKNKLIGVRVTAFAEDKYGFIWIGTLGGFNRFNLLTKEFRQYDTQPDQANSISSVNIRDLHYDADGDLWIATLDGLNKLAASEIAKPFNSNALSFIHYKNKINTYNSISSNNILCIYEDHAKRLWIGTDAGLNLLLSVKSGIFKRFYEEDGLPRNQITNILEDDNHNIWITTADGGICCLNTTTWHFKNYSEQDGLHSDLFNNNSCIKTQQGLFLLGGVNGVNAFNPIRVYDITAYPPNFYFTDFQVFNRSVPIGGKEDLLQLPIYLTSKISLEYKQKVFSLEFTTLNFIHQEKETYRYRLINFDKNWVYLNSERKITFTNLYPGTYHLEVEISNNKKDWMAAGKRMTIHIRAPWYLTWWFFTLLVLTLAGLAYFLYRYRINQIKTEYELQQQTKDSQMKAQLAQDKAQQLQALDDARTRLYTNITHEFRTPLTIILGMADKVEQSPRQWLQEGIQMIKRNGQSLLRLVNQMLDLSKLESGTMSAHFIQGTSLPI